MDQYFVKIHETMYPHVSYYFASIAVRLSSAPGSLTNAYGIFAGKFTLPFFCARCTMHARFVPLLLYCAVNTY